MCLATIINAPTHAAKISRFFESITTRIGKATAWRIARE
jgi:hypothetical protein